MATMTRATLAGVVLAAGLGTRLRPLTDLRPKALCPVADKPLIDHAVDRLRPYVDALAVNAHHHADQVLTHLAGTGVHVSREDTPMGSGGAIRLLADWIGRRDVLIHNADSWLEDDLSDLVDGWDGRRPRLLVTRADGDGDFGGWDFVGVSLLPNRFVHGLPAGFSGLYDQVWGAAHATGEIEFVEARGHVVDTGTPSDYLRANLLANGGQSVIGRGAVVEGTISDTVVWDGCRVDAHERLRSCIRGDGGVTVSGLPPRSGRGS